MNILFHTPMIDVRGSCIAVYDYAHYKRNPTRRKKYHYN